MKADYHTHTNFSTDADRESSPEVMIQGAIKRGLETICITDHMDKDYDAEGKGFVFDTEKYFETLQSLRELAWNSVYNHIWDNLQKNM